MKETIGKRRYHEYASIYFVLILSIFISSCTGQNKTPLQQESTEAFSTNSMHTRANEHLYSEETSANSIQAQQPISEVVREVFQDTKGNLWIGTQNGAYRYNGKALKHFDAIRCQRNKGVTIKDIAEDPDGNIWFGHTGGVSKYDGESITNYSEKDGLINNDVWCISIDHKGLLWIGTLQGACIFNGEEFHPFAIPEAKPDTTRGVTSAKIVHSIMEDRKRRMWFGTNGGAYIYDGKTLTNLSEKDGLCNNNVGKIVEDKNGHMWIGTTHNGLCHYDGNSFTNISEQEGLIGREIWDVYLDHSGNIWVTGKRTGIYRYDGKSLTHFNAMNGFTSPGIMSVLEDNKGQFWFGGVKGLFRLEGESFINVGSNGPWGK